jgi:hypothetical protein
MSGHNRIMAQVIQGYLLNNDELNLAALLSAEFVIVDIA